MIVAFVKKSETVNIIYKIYYDVLKRVAVVKVAEGNFNFGK